MRFSIAKFVVLAAIVVLAITAVNKYTSEKIETEEGVSLEEMLTAGLADGPATETEEEWDKPYSKKLVELIDAAESGEKKPQEQTEEDRQKMAGIQAGEIFNEEFSMKSSKFPYIEKIELEERSRYSVSFATDKPIRFVVYAESSYESWQASGQHTRCKITTKSGPECCASEGSYTMDINADEGGIYYFVFDESDINFESELPTQAKLQVTQTGGI